MAINPRDLSSRWFFRKEWSFKNLPPAEDYRTFGQALLVCVNGDGELMPAERDWVIGYLASKGATEQILAELTAYRATDDIASVVSRSDIVNRARRAVVFDAIRACSADGEFSPAERATVRKLAAALDVPDDVVEQLEAAHLDEVRATARRIKLVFPEGTPA
jgi:tellurite resistance protein